MVTITLARSSLTFWILLRQLTFMLLLPPWIMGEWNRPDASYPTKRTLVVVGLHIHRWKYHMFSFLQLLVLLVGTNCDFNSFKKHSN